MRYVGLDVHKNSVRACVLDEQGRRVLGQTAPCTRDDLQAFCQKHLRPDDRVALEATTNSWAVVEVIRPWVGPITVSNPLRTKAIAQAKVKTDKVDAEVLAQLLRCDYLPEVWEPPAEVRRLRHLTSLRTALMGDRTRIKNRIQSLLAERLIQRPHATLFSKQSREWLRTLPLSEDDRRTLDSQLRLLTAVEQEQAQVDRQLQQAARDEPQIQLLMTLPGVSYGTAVSLLAALGDITRFHDGDHAASYLGLAPSTRQSAEHCYHGHITKAGNSHARWMLTQGMQHLARHPGPLGAFFRRIARRKNRNVAVIASARKLVTIAYLMLKHNEPYRYALPDAVHRKFNRLPRTAGEPLRPRSDKLSEVCQSEGLPPVQTFDQLPAGERRMLAETGTAGFARRISGQAVPEEADAFF